MLGLCERVRSVKPRADKAVLSLIGSLSNSRRRHNRTRRDSRNKNFDSTDFAQTPNNNLEQSKYQSSKTKNSCLRECPSPGRSNTNGTTLPRSCRGWRRSRSSTRGGRRPLVPISSTNTSLVAEWRVDIVESEDTIARVIEVGHATVVDVMDRHRSTFVTRVLEQSVGKLLDLAQRQRCLEVLRKDADALKQTCEWRSWSSKWGFRTAVSKLPVGAQGGRDRWAPGHRRTHACSDSDCNG